MLWFFPVNINNIIIHMMYIVTYIMAIFSVPVATYVHI